MSRVKTILGSMAALAAMEGMMRNAFDSETARQEAQRVVEPKPSRRPPRIFRVGRKERSVYRDRPYWGRKLNGVI